MTNREKKRRVLLNITEIYLEALIDKKPENVPVSSKLKCKYNGEDVALGDSELWRNTLLIKERQTFIDPDSNQVVFFGIFTNVLQEQSQTQEFPIDVNLYALYYTATIRLKIVDGLITQIEELASSSRLRNFPAEKRYIKLPEWQFKIPIPEEERSTKEELISIVDTYWDCAAKWQPAESFAAHPDAQRFEEGFRTTNHTYSFRGDFKHNPGFRWDTPKSARRYPVVDPSRGLIVSYCFMEGENNEIDDKKGALIVEAFRIEDGALCYLMAFFPFLSDKYDWNE